MSKRVYEFARLRCGDTVGPYRLVRELGGGSSGIVYLAERVEEDGERRPSELSGLIALKLLRPQRVAARRGIARFLRTAEFASRLDVPNVCPVEGSGTHEGVPWLALRFLDGATVAEWIAGRRADVALDRPAIDRLLLQFEKLACAVHELHQKGITHRDIKPSNILVDRQGEPWLLDFGLMLASEFEGADQHAGGSPAYMAPELLRGDGRAGVATDLFALGVTLFEAVTGRLPFEAATVPTLLQAIAADVRPRARQVQPTVPIELDGVFERLLAARPASRHASGRDLAEDLRRIRERLPLASRPLARVRRVVRWVRRNRLATGCLLLLLGTLPIVVIAFVRVAESRARAELLSARAELDSARASAAALLPAGIADARSVAEWLKRHAGPGGLPERLRRVRTAQEQLQEGASPTVGAPAFSRQDMEAELRTFEQLPRWLQLVSSQKGPVQALPALVPAINRHQRAIETQLDAPVLGRATWASEQTERFAGQLASVAADLQAALGPDGVVARMTAELKAVERTVAAQPGQASSWQAATEHVERSGSYAAAVAKGLRLRPIEDLAPLGPDPTSGLQEFALLRSGRVPPRLANGRLEVAADTALVFVLLPGGTFRMGATSVPGQPESDGASLPDESPITEVTLSPFLLSKYELTQAQWLRLGGGMPAVLRAGDRVGATTITDLHPVEGVSFRDAEHLLGQHRLVLPTEAQWEFAVRRSGLTEPFGIVVNLRGDGDGYPMSHAPVGSFPADRCGLHDLIGNVVEMVADHYGNYDLAQPRPGDGLRFGWRPERMTRGGGFFSEPSEARPARRSAIPDFGILPFVGIRPVYSWRTP